MTMKNLTKNLVKIIDLAIALPLMASVIGWVCLTEMAMTAAKRGLERLEGMLTTVMMKLLLALQ